MTIDVTNAADTAVPTFTWAAAAGGDFSDKANWNIGTNVAGLRPEAQTSPTLARAFTQSRVMAQSDRSTSAARLRSLDRTSPKERR